MASEAERTSLEARVQELEVRSAFAERTTDELDEVVRVFTAKVERLEREIERLRALLEGQDEDDEGGLSRGG